MSDKQSPVASENRFLANLNTAISFHSKRHEAHSDAVTIALTEVRDAFREAVTERPINHTIKRTCAPLKTGQWVLLPFAGPEWHNLFRVGKRATGFGADQWEIISLDGSGGAYACITGRERITATRAKKIQAAYKKDIEKRLAKKS